MVNILLDANYSLKSALYLLYNTTGQILMNILYLVLIALR